MEGRKAFLFKTEHIIIVVFVLLSALITWRVNSLGMVKALVDQNSHLNISRELVDSMTPGISQIGFWPPLLHIIMAPITAIDPLYRSGLAGFVTLLPFLILSAIYLYRVIVSMTGNRYVSAWAVTLLLLNPFMLYYTATPMMEVMFLAHLAGAAYFMLRWLRNEQLTHLLLAAAFVTLATMSRFEGIFLIPVSFLIVFAKLVRQRKKYLEIEANLIIFAMVSIVGIGFILVYGYIFGNSPLAFMNSSWSAFNQQRDYYLPTQHNIGASFQYLIHASYHMLGKPYVHLALVAFPLALLLSPSLETIAIAAMFLTPFIFDFVALYRGNAIIYVPELPPYGVFFNERYGLYWILFALIIPAIAVAAAIRRSQGRWFHRPLIYILSGLLTVSIIWSAGRLYSVAYVKNFQIIKDSAQGYPSEDQAQVARVLKEHYDYGKIFMTRALHDFVAVEAGIPMSNYIQEGNYRFYDQALERPWLFARWVVMFNPNTGIQGGWAEHNEKISGRWGNQKLFLQYYDLVVENKRERLYRLKEPAVIDYAALHDYDVKAVPSLNKSIDWWDPPTVYAQMADGSFKADDLGDKELPTRLLVKSQMKKYYEDNLRPHFANGYYLNEQTKSGHSEGQSYALLQSYFADDRNTFEKVWRWTRANLQRKEDNLFSWKFQMENASDSARIIDENSATDADIDIATALLLAGRKWRDPSYLREASLIVRDIGEYEVASVSGSRYITAGNWANGKEAVVVNPSYFSPLSARLFAEIDSSHDWKAIARDGYAMLFKASDPDMHPGTGAFLPSDWVQIDKKTGDMKPWKEKPDGTDYTYDAFRTFWRVGMDALLAPNDNASEYMGRARYFELNWKDHPICTIYRFSKDTCELNMGAMTGPLSAMKINNHQAALAVVERYYVQSQRLDIDSLSSFYDKSWYWFGLALWSEYVKDPVVR